MKNMKKIVALLVAVLMLMSSFAAFATSPATAGTWTGAVDQPLTITGLQEGDSVKFYRVLEYNQDATTTGSWKKTTAFDSLSTDAVNKILGLGDYATGGTKADKAGIDADLAGDIGKLAVGNPSYDPVIANATGTASIATPDAGLYIAIITPAVAGMVYNPVFVGADYYTEDPESKTWQVTEDMTYSDTAMAKKDTITLTKTAEDEKTIDENKQETVSVGDKVTFTVNTEIPEFADNYINAIFKVVDQLSAGLALDIASIKVYKDSVADANLLSEAGTYSTGVAYKLTTDTSANDTYTVDFYTQYILGLDAATPIVIQYDAEVTNEATYDVNHDDNTVTLYFSNNPEDTVGKNILRDKTNHYTFTIDGMLWGSDSYKTTEVVKVGLDKDGNEITKTTELSNGNLIGALQGATFGLYTTQADAQAENNNYYTNDLFTGTVISGADGRINIKGLDAGTYYLKELSAPAGYIRDQRVIPVVITANITEKTVTENVTVGGESYSVTYKTNSLDSYSISIDGVTTATYTLTNNATDKSTIESVNEGDKVGNTNVGDDNDSGKIKNRQGVELPSTGGMGTTILYIGGSILVILAAVLLITKRRMNAED